MTKTISSARCVVEFLKVMSTPLPTFSLPSKQQQQDENENPLLPDAGISGFAETPSSRSNCSAAASSPSLPSSSQPGASTASPTTSVCSRDAFATPGNSPELVISGHL